jgi:hypothetical protein
MEVFDPAVVLEELEELQPTLQTIAITSQLRFIILSSAFKFPPRGTVGMLLVLSGGSNVNELTRRSRSS